MFDRPGLVILGCNIHDWMVAYVYVSESPHFARTDRNGRAEIEGLAARGFVLRVWHPQRAQGEDATRRSVDLARTRRADLLWSIELKAEARVRRAPASLRGGHY